jgi:hypothetical protein
LVYGVVCRVSTEPLDTSRPVLARGESASSEEEVFRNNLQLARLLTTRFDALIAGHRAGDDCRHFLPPLPPPVHSFVYACSSGEMAQLTNSLEFIRLLLNSGVPVVDEVVGACLRALASELAGDVPRLNSIPSTAS